MTARRLETLGVASAIVVGAILRFAAIGRLSLWFDEGYTAWLINHPIGEIIRLIRADTAPPLYYLLLHGWAQIFGRSEAALRGLSAFLGILTIPLVAAIARRLLSKSAAVIVATWLFVVSYPQIWYCQEARTYELMAFLTALEFYLLLRHLAHPCGTWRLWLIVVGIAALYANNFMALYLLAIASCGLVLPSATPIKTRLRDGAVIAAILGVAYLPWVSSLASQIQRVHQSFWIPRPDFDAACSCLAWIVGIGHFWTWDRHLPGNGHYDVAVAVPRVAALFLIGGIGFGLFRLRGAERRTLLALVIGALFVPLATAILSQSGRSLFLLAAFLPSTVIAPIIIAGPLAWRPRSAAGAVIAGVALLVCAINLWAFELENNKEDWRSAAHAVESFPKVEHRLIVFVANEAQLPFDYYYKLQPGEQETGAPAGYFDIDPPRTQLRVLTDSDLNGLRRTLASRRFDDIVLIISHAGWFDRSGIENPGFSDPDALTWQYVTVGAPPVERFDLPDDSANHAITILRSLPRRRMVAEVHAAGAIDN